MGYIACAIIGYLIGSINPAYFMGKRQGVDIREKGSKNAGATNTFLLFGKARGLICATVDILKAFLAILLTGWLMPDFAHSFSVTAAACVLGHTFPFYIGFRGGKGTACLGGIILAYNWRLFLVMLTCEVVVIFVTGYLCFLPVSASIAFPVIYYFSAGDILGAVILTVITAVILWKNIENFQRIHAGTEMRLSFLWKPSAELERIKKNMPEEDVRMHEQMQLNSRASKK